MLDNIFIIFLVLELDDEIMGMMFKSGTQWVCSVCGKSAARKIDISRHVEARHVHNLQIACQQCQRFFKTRDSLRKHCVSSHA